VSGRLQRSVHRRPELSQYVDQASAFLMLSQVPRPLARPRRRQAPETHLASVSPMSESSHGSLVERRRGASGRGLSYETSGSQTRPKRSKSGEGVHQSAEPTSVRRPVQPYCQEPDSAQRRRPATSAAHKGQGQLLAASQRLQEHAASPRSSPSSPTSTVTTREVSLLTVLATFTYTTYLGSHLLTRFALYDLCRRPHKCVC
jgi:hypothetical protein